MIRALVLAALVAIGLSTGAQAQSTVITTCGSPTVAWVAGQTGRPLYVDTNGNLCTSGGGGGGGAVTQGTTPWVVAGEGAAGTAAAGVVTVQGIASMTPVQVSQATASSLNAQVVGSVASAAADSGNPVKVGCVYNTTLPTGVNLSRYDCQSDVSGNQRVLMAAQGTTGADGIVNTNIVWPSLSSSPTAGARPLGIAMHAFNSSSWDRIRTIGAITADGTAGTGVLANGSVVYNGATWDRQYVCNSTAVINVTAGSTTELVALTASQIIRVCSFAVSMSAAGTAQFVYGTGTNCGTGTTSITGAVPLATATPWAQSGGAGTNLFRTASANALCLAAVTGNAVGYVTYAKY